MTTAIPFIFPPIEYKGCYYCDGALRENFPSSVLSSKAWGILPKRDYIKKRPKGPVKTLTVPQLISKVINIRYENSKNNSIHIKRLIEIDVGDITSTSFEINNDLKLMLIQKGVKAVLEFILFPIVNELWEKTKKDQKDENKS